MPKYWLLKGCKTLPWLPPFDDSVCLYLPLFGMGINTHFAICMKNFYVHLNFLCFHFEKIKILKSTH